MPRFLDTRDEPTYGIGICGRCSRKFPLRALMQDPNSPGLRVCQDDLDVLDPYRLPPKTPDPITLPFYRPDRSVAIEDAGEVPLLSGYFVGNVSGSVDAAEPVPIPLFGTYAVTSLAEFEALVVRPDFVVWTDENEGAGGFFVWMAGDTTPADGVNVIECDNDDDDPGRYLRFNFAITIG